MAASENVREQFMNSEEHVIARGISEESSPLAARISPPCSLCFAHCMFTRVQSTNKMTNCEQLNVNKAYKMQR